MAESRSLALILFPFSRCCAPIVIGQNVSLSGCIKERSHDVSSSSHLPADLRSCKSRTLEKQIFTDTHCHCIWLLGPYALCSHISTKPDQHHPNWQILISPCQGSEAVYSQAAYSGPQHDDQHRRISLGRQPRTDDNGTF